jgi:mannose-6-phosphate isomerase-like protein (cupin superfamily)
VFLVEASPGRGAPLHIHEYDEIVMTEEGRARLVVGDEIRETVPGDIVVIKARTPHGFVNIGDGILRQVDIHVSPRFKQQNLEATGSSRKAMLPAALPELSVGTTRE